MTAVNEQIGVAVITKLRCKQWDCRDCAKVNSDLWIMRAVLGCEYFESLGFGFDLVTVTGHERLKLQHTIEKFPACWDKLRRRWQAVVEKPQYIIVPEIGSRGHFHIHIITTGSLGTNWWKNNARSSGFGYMAKESERQVNKHKAGWYVGKYLSKQLHVGDWQKGFHRVRTSRYWPKIPPLPAPNNACFHPFHEGTTVRSVFHQLQAQGYSVALADEKASWHTLKTGELTEGSTWLTMNTPLIFN